MSGHFNLTFKVRITTISYVPPLKKAEEVEAEAEAPAKEIRTPLRRVPHILAEASISLLLRTDKDPLMCVELQAVALNC